MQPELSVRIGKIKLKNPVMVASGTFGYAEEFKDFVELKKLGAIVSKTITIRPRQGNPPPRTCETPYGMLNSIGLENPGIDVFIEKKLPFLKKIKVPVIVSIAKRVTRRTRALKYLTAPCRNPRCAVISSGWIVRWNVLSRQCRPACEQ